MAIALALASFTAVLAIFLVSIAVYWWYAHGLESPASATGAGPSVAYDRSGQSLLYQFADPLEGVREPV
ncbi:MAG TPA: hypothetical protein VFP63_02730, partial [Dehalococcoidia bacterium]|nr:hypothetical protein [Dehalococcoidia bacterium]